MLENQVRLKLDKGFSVFVRGVESFFVLEVSRVEESTIQIQIVHG